MKNQKQIYYNFILYNKREKAREAGFKIFEVAEHLKLFKDKQKT